MKTKRILALMIMSVSTATGLWAQIDVRSHAIMASYMDFVKAHGAEMDEGFPIPGWSGWRKSRSCWGNSMNI